MLFIYSPMEPMVRAYEQERLREAEQARLRRLAREGRAGTGNRQELQRALLAVRGITAVAGPMLAALVVMSAIAALLIVSMYAPALG